MFEGAVKPNDGEVSSFRFDGRLAMACGFLTVAAAFDPFFTADDDGLDLALEALGSFFVAGAWSFFSLAAAFCFDGRLISRISLLTAAFDVPTTIHLSILGKLPSGSNGASVDSVKRSNGPAAW